MELRKGEKCYVCGKEGTAKDLVPRSELSIRSLKENSERTVRGAVDAGDANLRVFAESSKGERGLDDVSKIGRGLQVGDYLRVLAESKSGELRESIFKLTQ